MSGVLSIKSDEDFAEGGVSSVLDHCSIVPSPNLLSSIITVMRFTHIVAAWSKVISSLNFTNCSTLHLYSRSFQPGTAGIGILVPHFPPMKKSEGLIGELCLD